MSSRPLPQEGNGQPWLALYVALAGFALAAAATWLEMLPLPWLAAPLPFLLAGLITFWCSVLQTNGRRPDGWTRVFFFRTSLWILAGVWATWAVKDYQNLDHTSVFWWGLWLNLALPVGTVAMAAVGWFCPTPARLGPREKPAEPEQVDRRPQRLRLWEAMIRRVTNIEVEVTGWKPWEVKEDGFRLAVDLPAEKGTTSAELAAFTDKMAAAARLPHGCVIRVLDSDRQGRVFVDVMTRNTLVDLPPVHVEPTTPASINDSFPVLRTPRGEELSVCMRIFSMVVGGTTGSGKTTFLHRLIMWLARCVDAVIWVVDLNGGGVAEPWINPWATGRADAPIVDWVADNEEEAALLLAVAQAIGKDRKTSKEATRRKREHNSLGVLPLDRDLPAIIVLTDEGGEVRQAASVLGRLAAAGITRLAQIGRAEGIRCVLSILRGTADITDKGFRVQAAIRVCLRMAEPGEYIHVLGVDPGKAELSGAVGAGYLVTNDIPRPVLGRTVNVDLEGIDAHAIACAPLRPQLDARAKLVASKIRARHVLGNRDPSDLMDIVQLQDAEDGNAYENRWVRYEAKLRQMRGEDDFDDDELDLDLDLDDDAPKSKRAAQAKTGRAVSVADSLPEGSALADLAQRWIPATASAPPASHPQAAPQPVVAVKREPAPAAGARIYQFPQQPEPASADDDGLRNPTQAEILQVITVQGAMGPEAIARAVNRSRAGVYKQLKTMTESGVLAKDVDGRYSLACDREANYG